MKILVRTILVLILATSVAQSRDKKSELEDLKVEVQFLRDEIKNAQTEIEEREEKLEKALKRERKRAQSRANRLKCANHCSDNMKRPTRASDLADRCADNDKNLRQAQVFFSSEGISSNRKGEIRAACFMMLEKNERRFMMLTAECREDILTACAPAADYMQQVRATQRFSDGKKKEIDALKKELRPLETKLKRLSRAYQRRRGVYEPPMEQGEDLPSLSDEDGSEKPQAHWHLEDEGASATQASE